MVVEIPVTQARAELAELVNRVVYGGERVVLTRHGRPVAAIVSAADLHQLSDTGSGGPVTEQTAAPVEADTAAGRKPIPIRPPLRIAAQDRPEATGRPDDRGTSPWV